MYISNLINWYEYCLIDWNSWGNSMFLVCNPRTEGAYFRQGHPKGVACEPLTATTKETLFYAQGGTKTHWA